MNGPAPFLAAGTRLEALKDYEARRDHKSEFILLGWIGAGVFALILLAVLFQKWQDRRRKKKPDVS